MERLINRLKRLVNRGRSDLTPVEVNKTNKNMETRLNYVLSKVPLREISIIEDGKVTKKIVPVISKKL